MWIKLLDNIQKYLFFWITGAIMLGLLQVLFFGGIPFSPSICLLAALIMIYPSLVPLSFNKIKNIFKKYNIILASILLNFVLSPFLAVLFGYIFLQNYPALWLGLILLSLLPGGGMVTTWALKSKADMPTTVSIVFINLLLAILITPFALSFAFNRLGASVFDVVKEKSCGLSEASSGVVSCGLGGGGVSPLKIALPIFFIIVVPLILAYFTQKIIKKKRGNEYFEKKKIFFGEFSNFGLIIVLFILMSLESNSILFAEPQLVFKSLIALFFFYLVNLFAVLFLYKKFFNTADGRALAWGGYLRYITLALGLGISLIYGNSNLAEMIIIIVLSYFIQIPISFWLASYFNKNN